jgi:capsular exopolysaccharide synthesis family protein
MTEPADTPHVEADTNAPSTAEGEGTARNAHSRFVDAYFGKDVSFEDGDPARPPSCGRPPAAQAVEYRVTRRVQPVVGLLEQQRVVSQLTHSQLADTFRILRTRVLHRMDAHGFRTIAVTSPSRGDGKTLTAVNLAINLAANPTRTVLLVDLDLRLPRVHEHFGLPLGPGLQDYLAGKASLAECLVNPEIERLVVLPAGGEPILTSSDLLASPAMTALAEELRARYADRIIVYDLPPLLASDDAISFLRCVDCCLLAVAEGRTRKRAFDQALDLLEGCTVLGTVFNRATEPPVEPYYKYYGKR